MKTLLRTPSGLALALIVLVQAALVFGIHDYREPKTQFLAWDAYGYYLYLPGAFIYHDLDKFAFTDDHHQAYTISGDNYQVREVHGRRVPGYGPGLALLWLPFFWVAHLVALALPDGPADGLSWPYQVAIAAASVFYLGLSFYFLRRVLRGWVSEAVTALTLVGLYFGTNLFYFAGQFPGLSHLYLFSLYAGLLWLTVHWHKQPQWQTAAGLGAVIAVMCLARPSEAVAVLIPLLYAGFAQEKWRQVGQHFHHIWVAAGVALALIFPQMLLWKRQTGQWIFNAYAAQGWGFAWAKPEVLTKMFGYGKGWLVYTPLMALALVGLLFLLSQAWKKWSTAVIPFVLINTYAVFCYNQWLEDLHFGNRGLVESYAVLALPLAALLQVFWKKKRLRLVAVALVLLGGALNLFQTWQFNQRILQPGQNTRLYYRQVFLKTHRDPLDLRYLDLKERKPAGQYRRLETLAAFDFQNEDPSDSTTVIEQGLRAQMLAPGREYSRGVRLMLDSLTAPALAGQWLTVRARLLVKSDHFGFHNDAQLVTEIQCAEPPEASKWVGVKTQRSLPLHAWTDFEYDLSVPTEVRPGDRLAAYLWLPPGGADTLWLANLALMLNE